MESGLTEIFKDKRVLIAGYGREGRSTHALLRTLGCAREIVVVEGNEAIRNAAANDSFDLIMKSPGVPMSVFDGIEVEHRVSSQTDVFLRCFAQQTIGITGTKGKSTTTSLIYHILRAYSDNVLLAGNIGIPLFEVIPDIDAQTLIVCELSCHQLEILTRSPHVGVCLNLYQEHLDHYRSYEDYQLAKLNMALRQGKDDYFYYCSESEDLRLMMTHILPRVVSHVETYGGADVARWQHASPQLVGRHNWLNAEVAARVARMMGINDSDIEKAMLNFNGLEHRMEYVCTKHGIRFYNDSISTIPASCMAAVEALCEVDTLVLGGNDRGIDYTPLAAYLTDTATKGWAVRNIAFVGKAGRRMWELCTQSLRWREHHHVLLSDDYHEIVDWCFGSTRQDAVCLLSPAASSYDMFKNFEERGHLFKQLITEHA